MLFKTKPSVGPAKYSTSSAQYDSQYFYDICISLLQSPPTQAAFCNCYCSIPNIFSNQRSSEKGSVNTHSKSKRSFRVLRYKTPSFTYSFCYILFRLFRAALFTCTAIAAISIPPITFVSLKRDSSTARGSLVFVVLHFVSKKKIFSLLLFVRPPHFFALRFPLQNLSSRQHQLLQDKPLRHIFPTKHFSVLKPVQTSPACALARRSSFNIFGPTCCHLAHGLLRK